MGQNSAGNCGQAIVLPNQLQALTQLAGEVRNRDIALEVLALVPGVQDGDLATQLAKERKQAELELVKALQRWTRRNLFRKSKHMRFVHCGYNLCSPRPTINRRAQETKPDKPGSQGTSVPFVG